jgi:aspartate kinase
MIVVKFGGTSVADVDAITRATDIVRGRVDRDPIVVVSAMAGVTNELLGLAEQAADGQLIAALRTVEGLRERHLSTAESLFGGDGDDEVTSDLSATFDELASLAEALSTLGHLTPRSLDTIGAMGEQLSAPLIAAVFERAGLPVELIDARQVVITSDAYNHAEPLPDAIADRARALLLPRVRDGRIPVMGGFIGATTRGVTTTLGRGGSDYTASLVGAALRVDAIEIWTDVDGMLTADPRIVEGARLIERIRFDEASELATFGAKVLHPNTIAPAVELGIPVYVFNSHRPGGSGTQITFDAPRCAVRAVAGKTGLAVVKVKSPRMLLAHGFLRTVFDIFARHRTSVDVVATSEVSVSVTVDENSPLEEVISDLSALGDVSIERNRGIIALVGAGLSDDGAAMARALTAIGSVRVHMLSLSATGINLTIIIDSAEVNPVMTRLHDAFFPSECA